MGNFSEKKSGNFGEYWGEIGEKFEFLKEFLGIFLVKKSGHFGEN